MVGFSEEQEAFRESVRRLARERLRDGYFERAKSEAFPREAYRALAGAGLLELGFPADLGGAAADHVTRGIAVEEVSRADFNLGMYEFYGVTMPETLSRLPDPAERREWSGAFMRGERLACGAFTEPESGSDLKALRLRAVPDGDGWRLTGEKTSITIGPHADAAIVLATTDPRLGTRGIRSFFVDLDDPTVSRQRFRDPGWRPLGRAAITFDGTFVPRHRALGGDAERGGEGRGLQMTLRFFELSRTLLGLVCIGAAERAIEMTTEWVKSRKAFGQEIARFQGVSFPLAEHATHLEAGRWLCYRALSLIDAGCSANREAAMCKWWLPQVATQAIQDCIVLHGQMGYSDEMPLSQMLLDVMGLQIGDGTPQIQKLIIARDLLGRDHTG